MLSLKFWPWRAKIVLPLFILRCARVHLKPEMDAHASSAFLFSEKLLHHTGNKDIDHPSRLTGHHLFLRGYVIKSLKVSAWNLSVASKQRSVISLTERKDIFRWHVAFFFLPPNCKDVIHNSPKVYFRKTKYSVTPSYKMQWKKKGFRNIFSIVPECTRYYIHSTLCI